MALKPNMRVGAFDLVQQIGLGGMGEVWKARHHLSGSSVAIKVVTASRSSEERYRDVFAREVQAVAALSHPGVIAIYDHGQLKLGAEPPVPWYAMELATSSLAHSEIEDWPTLREVLVEILDGLGHAHARGVIHRDLKPENVLLTADLRVKLTDFGMAHVIEYSDDTNQVFGPGGGTPDFMAPEQFRGAWRKFGPWTDLYALGCVAWELATGNPPFVAGTVVEIALQHIQMAPAPMQARFPVPEGLEAWIRRLVAKAPRDRFRRAADARHMLITRVDTSADAKLHAIQAPAGRPTRDNWEFDTLEREAPKVPRDTLEDPSRTRSYDAAPPLPANWRQRSLVSRAELFGVGLGLFGIREIPFVGREEERDLLWQNLRQVSQTGENRAVLLWGDSGSGRSRLAQWVGQCAEELGGATLIRASHQPIPGRQDGIAGAVVRHLAIDGATAGSAEEIVRSRLGDDFDASLLLDLLYGYRSDESTARSSTLVTPMQRYIAVERLLAHMADERPVIFWIDDAHWGADALNFVAHALPRDLRTLIIVGVRSDVLHDRYWESRLLTDLAQSDRAESLQLPALTEEERIQLLRGMLDLEEALARNVARQGDGSPAFAVQVVADWVQQELLEEGDGGFQLRSEAEVHLPGDVRTLWFDRIDGIERSAGLPARTMLQLAAVLGTGDDVEWPAACAALGLAIPDGFVDLLVRRRLATREGPRWVFQNAMLREALIDEVAALESAPEIYSACADAVSSDPLRKAEFLLRANRIEAAVESLLAAETHRMLGEELEHSSQVLELCRELLDELRVPPGDPRRGEVAVRELANLRISGAVAEGRAFAEKLVGLAEEFGWVSVAADAHVHLGLLGELSNEPLRDVLGHFDEAMALYHELDSDLGRAKVLRALSQLHANNGKYDVAKSLAEKALELYREHGHVEGTVSCLTHLGLTEVREGRVSEARSWLERARDIARTNRLRHSQALAINGLGEIAHKQGDYDSAARLFREAQDLWDSIGSQTAAVAANNSGLLQLDLQDFIAAQAAFELVDHHVEAGGLPSLGLYAHAGLAACAADSGDATTYDLRLGRLKGELRATGFHEAGVANVVKLAGEIWARRVDKSRARAAFDVARNEYLALGAGEQADDIARAIGRL